MKLMFVPYGLLARPFPQGREPMSAVCLEFVDPGLADRWAAAEVLRQAEPDTEEDEEDEEEDEVEEDDGNSDGYSE